MYPQSVCTCVQKRPETHTCRCTVSQTLTLRPCAYVVKHTQLSALSSFFARIARTIAPHLVVSQNTNKNHSHTPSLRLCVRTTIPQALVWVDWAGSGSTVSNEIEALLTVVPATPVNQYAQKYLEAFSRANWGTYCLAHLLTYTDFSGTLGEQHRLLLSKL